MDWKRYGLFAATAVGMVVSMAAFHGRIGVAGESRLAIAILGGVVAATAYAFYQHRYDDAEYDERSMQIRYRSGYVSFWAVYGLLFVFAIGTMGATGGDRPVLTAAVDPATVLLATWAFGTVVALTTRTWYGRQF